MLYLHDIWFNWFDGAMKPYEVCEFHEWRKTDKVELGDQVPLFYVKKPFFDYVEDGMNDLPEDLLLTVSGRSFSRRDHDRTPADIFVITDGERVLGVDTTGLNIPIRKSRLIPRQESLVFEMIAVSDPLKFEFTPIEGPDDDILNTPPNYVMFGLTRKERELKSLLFEGLTIAYHNASIAKMRYLYGELNYKNLDAINDLDQKAILDLIIEEASVGWTDKHLQLLKFVIKSAPYLEKLYNEIVGNKKGEKKVG